MVKSDVGGYTYHFDEERRIIYIKAEGSINFKMTTAIMDNVASDPLFESSYKVLVDLTEMDFHPSFDEFNGIRDHILLLKKHYRNRVALVFSGLLKSLGDLVAEVTRASGMHMKSFYTTEKAEAWLLNG